MTLIGGVSFLQGEANYNATQHPLLNIAERAADADEVMRRNNDKLSRDIRVAMPAQVISFDAEKQTIVAQPLIREKIINRQNGQKGFVTLPQLVDIPVCFPQAGNFVLTMPIQAGDEVLLIFNDTCIDSWWASGGIQNWNDRRRHDLSDAIAVVGLNSVPNVIPDIASDATELRTKDGAASVTVQQEALSAPYQALKKTSVTLLASGYKLVLGVPTPYSNSITLDESGIKINGQLYTAHTHPVTTAPGTTGGVNP